MNIGLLTGVFVGIIVASIRKDKIVKEYKEKQKTKEKKE